MQKIHLSTVLVVKIHKHACSTMCKVWLYPYDIKCDTFATIMLQVCYDVEDESSLHLLHGENFYKSTSTDDNARLEIKKNSVELSPGDIFQSVV